VRVNGDASGGEKAILSPMEDTGSRGGMGDQDGDQDAVAAAWVELLTRAVAKMGAESGGKSPVDWERSLVNRESGSPSQGLFQYLPISFEKFRMRTDETKERNMLTGEEPPEFGELFGLLRGGLPDATVTARMALLYGPKDGKALREFAVQARRAADLAEKMADYVPPGEPGGH